ncbi:glycosyl transferase family 2 [Pyrenophora seminiperda CCB06]|uniref:Glycosyl transferase family 2 n=1 Tax=Pyrenophora seminiperda CCB06 TaxID=1302712 RepID=A0A3M7MIM2_9PLEO|nr:glycosyl transferase family 2 [Pyrenophora seminiperda CCB06]
MTANQHTMADTVEETKQSISGEGQADANASVGGKGSAESSSKKTERKTPKKLGGKKPQQQPTPEATPAPDSDGEGKAEQEDAESKKQSNGADADDSDEPQQEKSKSQSRRRQSRGRGRRGAESGAESDARSDVSQSGGRRNRQRQKKGGKGGGPLDDITENVPGGEVLGGAGDMVQNTAGNAVNQVGNTAGKALGGLTGGGDDKEGGKDGGEQLRLRLELNLDIEIQLKAKIHGDLTLGLLIPDDMADKNQDNGSDSEVQERSTMAQQKAINKKKQEKREAGLQSARSRSSSRRARRQRLEEDKKNGKYMHTTSLEVLEEADANGDLQKMGMFERIGPDSTSMDGPVTYARAMRGEIPMRGTNPNEPYLPWPVHCLIDIAFAVPTTLTTRPDRYHRPQHREAVYIALNYSKSSRGHRLMGRMYTIVPGKIGIEGYDSFHMTRATQDWCAYFSAISDPISAGIQTSLGQDAHVPITHTPRCASVASNYTPSRTSRTYSSNDVRFSLDSTVLGSPHAPDIPIDQLEELVDSIGDFKFTAMVTATTLNRIADMRSIVDMTGNNLLNAAWDLQRLYMVWSEITLGAPSADVAGIVKPWSRLSKKRVAKACQNMKHALSTHQTWSESMNSARTLAINLNVMSNRWWIDFDERHGELATLDPHDIAGQVAVVMEMYLEIREEGVVSNAFACQRSSTHAPFTRPPSAMRLKNSSLPPVAENSEVKPLEKTRHSITTSHWKSKPTTELQVPRWSLPAKSGIPQLVQRPSSSASMHRASDIKYTINFSRPTRRILMARQSLLETNQAILQSLSPPQAQPHTNTIKDSQSDLVSNKIHLRAKSEELPTSSLISASTQSVKAPRPVVLRAFPSVPSKIERSIGRTSTESHRPILGTRRSISTPRLSATLPRNYA